MRGESHATAVVEADMAVAPSDLRDDLRGGPDRFFRLKMGAQGVRARTSSGDYAVAAQDLKQVNGPAMILTRAQHVLRMEAQAVQDQARRLGRSFVEAVEMLSNCRGRVAVLGIGKSGLIGRKISATLASTGTPSFFLHPVEGLHGDLGMMMSEDCVLALSYSGETEELKRLLPWLRQMRLPLIAITGRQGSRLGRAADVVIRMDVRAEACPYNLTPTTSTTAMLALGDALALAIMERKGFNAADFARLHPGGTLGKRLHLRVADLMRRGRDNPIVREGQTVRQALAHMTRTRLGATNVVDRTGRLVGYFTDGDFRRISRANGDVLDKRIRDVMTPHPRTISPHARASEAATLLKRWECDNMPVVNERHEPIGVLDERDLLDEGLL